MIERDMMYGGYYQGIPNNMMYGNFGYQGPPGSFMQLPPNNNMFLNNYNDINTRINDLENRIRKLEKMLDNNSNQDDNSLYII